MKTKNSRVPSPATLVAAKEATALRTLNQTQMPIRPTTFREAVNARLSSPIIGLFNLHVRLLQLVFALASGISYALELSSNNPSSVFIYSQVVFGLTLAMLLADAVTLRSYKLDFVLESVLCVLWLALFGSCYVIFYSSAPLEPQYAGVNTTRMKNAVWLDLINFVLWLSSAAFSTAMCCLGTSALIRGKWQSRRGKKTGGKRNQSSDMETGLVPPAPVHAAEEQLPAYEDVAEPARREL